MGYGLRQRQVSKDEEARRVGEALALVRLAGYERRRTWEMSGGQQQRVALARALVNHPTVLLLDEPLGALDLKLRKEMQLELKALQREVGITFVYVTHDQEEALTMSDVIVVMRDGRIQQQGGPSELYERPVNRFVADFIGSSNFIPATVEGFDSATRQATVRSERGLLLRGRVTDPAATVVAGRFRHRGHAPGTARGPGRRRPGDASRARLDGARRTDPPGDLSRRPDGVPGAHRHGRRADRPATERGGRGERPRGMGRATRWSSAGTRRPTSSWLDEEADRRRHHDVEEERLVADQDRDAFMARLARTKVNRRSFLAAAGLIGGGAALAACTGSTGTTAAPASSEPSAEPSTEASAAESAAPSAAPSYAVENELFMYNWSDYVGPGQHGELQGRVRRREVPVRHLRQQRGAAGQAAGRRHGLRHRLLRPPSTSRRWSSRGYIQKLDFSRIPNSKYIDTAFKGLWWDPNDEYQLPKDFGTTGILYRDARSSRSRSRRGRSSTTCRSASTPARSSSSTRWATSSSMPLKMLGYSLNSVDPGGARRGRKILLDLAPHVLALDSDTYQDKLASEEAVLCLGWTGPLAGAPARIRRPRTRSTSCPARARCSGWTPG